MTITFVNIPAELRALNQWVNWKYEIRGDSVKPTKVPYSPSGLHAKTNKPETWSTLGAVIEAEGFDGIGIVFTVDDPYVGIDLDNALHPDGSPKSWAKKIIAAFATYTEVSPSGKGVKMWVKGQYPGKGTGKRRPFIDGEVEMYHTRRYFTVTGQRVEGTPAEIVENQATIDRLWNKVLNPPATTPQNAAGPSGDEMVQRAMKYIERCPDAVSGEAGHDKMLRAACECFRFGLTESDARRVLDWFNQTKCSPQWTSQELDHKIADALKKVVESGEFGSRARQIHEPRVEIAQPPKQCSELTKVIAQTVDGTIVNIAWPWPLLTRKARALMPGTITVLSGAGGSAKSFLVSEACLFWQATGVPFAVFHLEEDRAFHLLRAMAQLDRNANLTDDEWCREAPDELFAAHDRHEATLDKLGQSIWDAPTSDVSLIGDLLPWLRERLDEGRRVIVIDPVTAATPTDQPWKSDHEFVINAKRMLRGSGASLLVVTHPRSSSYKGDHLDNHAGGQAYNRFTQCVLALQRNTKKQDLWIEHAGMSLNERDQEFNRSLHVCKARNGKGGGITLAYEFDSATLTFQEVGVVK